MADDITEDTQVYPMMLDLAQCLCTAMADAGFTDMCFCGVQPGNQVLADYITEDSGEMAWVRLSSATPIEEQSTSSTGALMGACFHAVTINLEVGHAACATIPDGQETISAAQQLNMVRTQSAMMAAAKKAIECCSWAHDNYWTLSSWTPFGPDGGIVGGAWTVAVEVYG